MSDIPRCPDPKCAHPLEDHECRRCGCRRFVFISSSPLCAGCGDALSEHRCSHYCLPSCRSAADLA